MSRVPVRTALAALPLLGACSESPPAELPPSVVLVSLDTLRADHVGLYGYERDTTPYLDRFADECLVFERAFTPAPWTLISHMTMLTGLYPNQHGVVAGEWALSGETPILAERLGARGYQTVALYYEGWIHPRHGFQRGFDVFRKHANAEEAGEHLAEVLDALDPERPFFLFLHLFDVHSGPLDPEERGPIYDAPPPYDVLYHPDPVAQLPDMPEGQLWLHRDPLDAAALEALRASYDGGIRYVDDKLAVWFEDLRARGLLDRSLLFVTADHGESLGQRGQGIRDHGGAYQEGIHVPLLVRLPGGERGGERSDAVVHLADLVPTVLAIVGAPGDARLPGLELTGELPEERRVYGLSPEAYEMVIAWPQKYVRLVGQDRLLRADLAADPGETTGLPLTPEEWEAERAALLDTLEEYPPPAPVGETSDAELRELQERLNEMGYGGESE